MEMPEHWKSAAKMYRSGMSLVEIGSVFGVTGECVGKWVHAVYAAETDQAIDKLRRINARKKKSWCDDCAWRTGKGVCVLPGCFKNFRVGVPDD